MVERIVFMQGADADTPLSILDTDGPEAAIDYLAEWDNGDGGDVADEPSAGSADTTYTDDHGYILTYNVGLGYIGLERLVD
jgi:hypothetical protein